MRLGPPALQVLVAEHPRLAEGPVGYLRALTETPRLEGRVIPVETLTAGDRTAQSRRVIRPCEAIRVSSRMVGVSPVGQRHVVVDADRVDIRMRPKRIEVEIDIA